MAPFDLLLTSLHRSSPVCLKTARHVLCMLRKSVQIWDAMMTYMAL